VVCYFTQSIRQVNIDLSVSLCFAATKLHFFSHFHYDNYGSTAAPASQIRLAARLVSLTIGIEKHEVLVAFRGIVFVPSRREVLWAGIASSV
jgi:hypothetical protein